jgi:hypothetical protein
MYAASHAPDHFYPEQCDPENGNRNVVGATLYVDGVGQELPEPEAS